MDFDTNQILITGANGWLGKTLVESIVYGLKGCSDLKIPQKNIKVRCLILPGEDINYLRNLNSNIEFVFGNITNKKDCKLFTEGANGALLFHCAGIIHPSRVKHFYDINVKGSKNLIKSAIDNKLKKIIVVSSNSPIGVNKDNDHIFNENDEYNPYLHYGRSKMEMEKMVMSFANKGLIQATIIRPPWFYGPHQPKRQIRFYKMIQSGKVPIIGSGENLRSMSCTINICQGLIRAAIEEKSNGNIYWISDATPYSFNEIILTIRKVLETEFNVKCYHNEIKMPNLISELAYVSDKIIQGIGFYNKEIHVLSEMNKTIVCSIDKAKNELNFNPSIALYEGTYMSIKQIIGQI